MRVALGKWSCGALKQAWGMSAEIPGKSRAKAICLRVVDRASAFPVIK